MDELVYPAEAVYEEPDPGVGRPALPPAGDGGAQGRGRAARGLWNLFLPHKTQWTDGLSNLDYAPLAEIMGRSPHRLRGVQLLGAGHREHGDPHHVRHARAAGAVAPPAARGRDPLGVRDDRAGGRQLGRDEHRVPHRARRRRLRDQRAQVVDLRRGRRPLRGLHPDGQDRPGGADPPASSRWSSCPATRPASTSMRALPVFGYQRPGGSLRDRLRRRPGAGQRTCSARRAAGSPSPRPGSAPAASTTACG